jgi:A/G-specific adenine glycosylase
LQIYIISFYLRNQFHKFYLFVYYLDCLRISVVKISDILALWYDDHQRDLPWRKTKDPYAIWVSEIILQQTRVMQGIDYYHSFMNRFPDLQSLAQANIEQVLKVWQGLGYYTRARNMHAAAGQMVMDYAGAFPSTYPEILKLKGIGPYTAAAIASIAFNEPKAVIDGNVHRVIARIFGLFEPPGLAGAKCRICRHAEDLLDRDKPGIHNQAIMEFGALVCTPANPSCDSCPLQKHCAAFLKDMVKELPVRSRQIKKKDRYFHYFIIRSDDRILIRQRTDRDIWQHLFEFPLIETPRPISSGRLMESTSWNQWFMNSRVKPVRVSKIIRHTLTHQVIHAKFYHLDSFPADNGIKSSFQAVPLSELGKFPVPKLIENYLEKLID